MCYLCDENDGDMESCQDCGRLICFDLQSSDDVVAPAYVTSSGDLFCKPCGSAHDRAMEEADRDEWLAMWEDYPGELLEDTPTEEDRHGKRQ